MTKRSGYFGRTSVRELTAAVVLLAALPAIVAGLVLTRSGGPQTLPNRTPDRDIPQQGDLRQTGREISGLRRSAAPEAQEGVAEELVMQPQYSLGGAAAPGAGPEMADLTALLPTPEKQSPFRISTAAKQWPAAQMHEKINGEDVVYLDAGCLGLGAMTLANASGTESIDLYLFQMKTSDAARDVFAAQAPDAAAANPSDRPKYVDLGDKAYTTYGSCRLRTGRFYLKVLVNGESQAAADAALSLARKFAAKCKEHQ